METQRPEISNVKTVACPLCEKPVNETDAFCENCGYPLKGTLEEQQTFVNARDYKVLRLSEMNKKIKSASVTMLVIAGLFAVSGIIYFFILGKDLNAQIVLISSFILAAIYCAFGYWCKKQPAAAIISALVLYMLVLLLNVIDDPASIVKGIIVKIIIIVYLIKGLNSALEAQQIKKELGI